MANTNTTSLRAGAVTIDITPRLPIRLCGQYFQRIADRVFSPLCVNILALEGSDGHAAVFAACDLLAVSRAFTAQVRAKLAAIPDAPAPESVMLSAIHTHTAPYLANDGMAVFWGDDFAVSPDPAVETLPADYADWAAERIAGGIAEAWQSRQPATLETGFDHICISYNRRTRYRDGHVEMYGSTARPDFLEMEGGTDNGIHFALLRAMDSTPIAALIEVACPAQVMEHKDFVCADYWSVVRDKLADAMGRFPVVGLCGAAGDLSPRDLVRTAMDEPLMHATEMYNVPGMERVASRITEAFLRFVAEASPENGADLRHAMQTLQLPLRTVTEDEAAEAKREYDALRAKHTGIGDFTEAELTDISRLAATVNRLAHQQISSVYPVEVHALRLGSAVLLTNPFELYLAYADRMRAHSGTPNTMVVQLTCGYEGYLPTAAAVLGGGYSAGVNNGFIGPLGGDALVDETLSLLKTLDTRS